jgi:uncharacterized membrane protein
MTDAAGSEVALRRRSDVVLVGGVLLGVAVATFVYRLVVEALLDDGTFIAQDGYPGDLRDGALRIVPWVLVVGAIVAGVIAWRRHELCVTRATIGAVLLGAGPWREH